MAFPEPAQPSRRLTQAVVAERARLESELVKAQNAVRMLRQRVAESEQQVDLLERRLQLLDGLGVEAARTPGTAARPQAVRALDTPRNGWLRGAAIREVAVRLLAASTQPERPVHYTDWLQRLIDAGYGIQGRDPAATFLTQLSRSPVVTRADAPGHYTLDLSAPSRLRERLIALNDELLALHHGQQTIEEISSARERRNDLVTEIARIERQLEEALAAVGSESSVAD
jgi:hypothetical protein